MAQKMAQANKWEERVKRLESLLLGNDISEISQKQVFYERVFELEKEVLGDREFPGITFRISAGQIVNRIMLGVHRLPQLPNCKRVEKEREDNVAHAIEWAKTYSRFK